MAHSTNVSARNPWRMRCWLLAAVAGLLAGCVPENFAPANDPILGGAPYQPSTANPVAANNTPRPSGAIPPIPGPPAAGGNAILAGGSSGPSMDPSRNLQLGSGPAPATLTGSTGNAGAANWTPPTGGPIASTASVTIGVPTGSENVTVIPAGPSPNSGVPVVPAPVATGVTVDSLLSQLMARGMIYQSLVWPGGKSDWQFKCAVPSRQNRDENRVIDTHGPDPISAIKTALDRIDSDR